MLSLRKCLKDVANAVKALKGISNSYYYTSASGVTGSYATTLTVCTLKNIPEGTYLILAQTAANVGTTTIMNASIAAVENCTVKLNCPGRATGEAGGGCHAWAIVDVTGGPGSLKLTTYKYYSGTIGYSGRLAAIKLI